MMAGQISGHIKAIRPAKEIIDQIMHEANETIAQLSL